MGRDYTPGQQEKICREGSKMLYNSGGSSTSVNNNPFAWIKTIPPFVWYDLLGFSSTKPNASSPSLSDDALKNLFDGLSAASLTIAAISLGLLSNVGIALYDVPFRARQEIRQLNQIRDRLGEKTPLLLIKETEPNYGDYHSDLRLLLKIDPNKEVFDHPVQVAIQLPSIMHPVWNFPSKADKDLLEASVHLSDHESLANWQMFWNTLAGHSLLSIQPSLHRVFLEEVGNPSRTYPIYVDRGDPQNAPADATFDSPSGQRLLKTKVTEVGFEFPDSIHSIGPIKIKPPGAAAAIPIQLKDLVLVVVMGTQQKSPQPFNHFYDQCRNFLPDLRCTSSFDETFPNLAKLGPDYRALPLKDLDKILEVEGKRSKAQLDVLGAKIPSELVTFIGLPALFVLLLQFIASCRYILKNTNAISADVASKWVSAIREPGFLLFGFLTIAVLPFFAP